MSNYVFYGVDASTTIIGVNGIPITPTSASSLSQTHPGYSLEQTDVNCTCDTQETWLVYTGPIGMYSITTTDGIMVGVVYGPIPPRRPIF